MALLSIESVSKSYDKVLAIKPITFQLNEGEILGIVGRSGSGKTTLIKMLAGLLQPDSGKILFHNKPLKGPEDKLVPGHEEIRLVHQDFKLHHRMTVKENLYNALIEYVQDYKTERTDELLKLCQIDNIRDHYVHEISGGEKQRVAIAMALATEPEVLLFDEPFSNLDLHNKSIILHEIRSLARRQNTAVIMITHDSRDVMEIADSIMVLADGETLKTGTPKEVYNNPEYIETAQLMGSFNLLTQGITYQLDKLKVSEGQYGVWPENVLLGQGHDNAIIHKVIFMGAYNKVLIESNGQQLWAYDYQRTYTENDKVNFSIKNQEIFILKPSE